MKDFFTADINELLGGSTETIEAQISADEFTQAEYLADIARFRDFRPEAERMLWPSPVKPRWRN